MGDSPLAAKTVTLKSFTLLSFTGELTPSGLEKIEYVPSSWIRYDNELDSCVVQYMGPPYNVKTNKLLNDLIKAQAPAPADWPWYPIELKGHAETYTEANRRVNILTTASYAFTTDSESHGKKQADKMTEFYKNKSKESQISVEEILNISELLSSEDEDIVPSSQPNSDDSHESSDEESDVQARRKPRRSAAELSKQPGTSALPKKGNLSKKVSLPRKTSLPKKAGLVRDTDLQKKAYPPKKTDLQKKAEPLKKADLPTMADFLAKADPPKNKDHLKNTATSKNMFDATEQQANNHHFPPGEDIFELEKNLETQGDALEEVIKGFPQDTAFIYVALKKLTVEVKNVISEVEILRNSVERSLKTKVDQVSIVNFEQKYNVQKLSTVADYEAFDKRLVDDEEYLKDLKSAMECLVDSDLQRTITRAIRRICQRDLAMNCTAFRQSKNKLLLKGTKFYDVLFDFVGSFHKKPDGGVLTEKEFYNTLSACLTNSKDWDGNRKNRTTQPPAAVIPGNPAVLNPGNPAMAIPEHMVQNIEVAEYEN